MMYVRVRVAPLHSSPSLPPPLYSWASLALSFSISPSLSPLSLPLSLHQFISLSLSLFLSLSGAAVRLLGLALCTSQGAPLFLSVPRPPQLSPSSSRARTLSSISISLSLSPSLSLPLPLLDYD